MILSPRLKIIADSIHDCGIIADIGSDHAYLPIYLIKNLKVKNAIVTDVKSGPIEIAKKRLRSHRVENSVSVRQGNGLEVIKPGEADIIVIAGMGGLLIRDILDKDQNVALSAKSLVLQPMKDSEVVRKWLFSHHFNIIDEELVREEDRIYEVIWAEAGETAKTPEGLMLIGEKIIEKRHPLAADFIRKKVKELENIVEMLKGMEVERCREKTEECRRLIDYYMEVLQWVQ